MQAIKGYGFKEGINFNVFEADYDQIEMQVYDPTSELYEFSPDYVVIFFSSNKLLKKFWELNTAEKSVFAKMQIGKYENIYKESVS